MTKNHTPAITRAIAKALATARADITTDEQVRDLPTRTKPYKAFLGRGLYVYVAPSGTKSFRFNYQGPRGAATHTIGKFGKYTLAMALAAFERAREALTQGECIRAQQTDARTRARSTVADAFNKWFPVFSTRVCAAYAARTRRLMESDDLTPLMARPLAALDFRAVRKFLQALEVKRSASGAREAAHALDQIFEHAREEGLLTGENPAHRVAAKLTALPNEHWEALQLEQVPLYYQDVATLARGSATHPETLLALRMLPYLTLRPSVLRNAQWSWVSWDTATLVVPAFAQGTKQRTTERRVDHRGKHYAPYRVPLSRQVLAMLRVLQPLTGSGKYLFPNHKGRKHAERPVSVGAWLTRIRAMGWNGSTDERPAVTVHGFRALFATAAYSRYVITRVDEHALEFQQDHKLTDGVRKHYTRDAAGSHRGLLLPQRAALMQWWADELDAVLAAGVGAQLPESRADRAAAFASRKINS
jgi:integrase